MTYEEKKSLYESIMLEIAKTVKRRINESDSVYTEIDGLKGSVLSASAIAGKFKGQTVRAYNPSVKAGSDPKDWQMYAVSVSDIKDAQAFYIGQDLGQPSYVTSSVVLYGKVSFIKSGNGQNWERSFPGKVIVRFNRNNGSLFFEPYEFSGKFEDMTPRSDSDNFTHFANRGVYVKTGDISKQIIGDKDLVNLLDNLCRGYVSDNAVKYLLKNKYAEIKDGELKKL